MTANQINFAKVQETERNNRVMEQETQRHNYFMEMIGMMNAQTEQAKAQETARSNLAREAEAFRSNNMDYDVRHEGNQNQFTINLMDQEVQRGSLEERVRHDKADELLTGINTAANFVGKILDVASNLARGALRVGGGPLLP